MFQTIPIGDIVESPLNPRKHFDPAQLEELANSIRSVGIVEPLVVRPLDVLQAVGKHPAAAARNGARFEIIAGARRFRAATIAQLKDVPALVKPMTDAEVLEIMVIENGQRDDLDPIEEASGYRRLIDSNPAKYSAALIAERIGRSEKYVWDRMKLLDLVPVARQLLEQGRMSAGHAILIARLKPEDQKRVIDPTTARDRAQGHGGLWQEDNAFEWDGPAKNTGKFDGFKAVSVRELEQWIADHIRFDVQQAAAAAPLDFGPVAERVQEATAKPGRGKKVIAITFDHFVQPEARADGERTFGPRSFKFADGEKHATGYPAREKVFPRCDYAVLGVVAAGEKYGQAFDVCIARDKCDVHWKQERAAREKNAKLRAKGQTAKADRNEAAAEMKRKREQVAAAALEQQWARAEKDLFDACRARVKTLKASTVLARAIEIIRENFGGTDFRKVKTADELLRLLVLDSLTWDFPTYAYEIASWTKDAAAIGIDVSGILKKHAPAQRSAEQTPGEKKPAAAKKKAAPKNKGRRS